jgi:hypothetical protein
MILSHSKGVTILPVPLKLKAPILKKHKKHKKRAKYMTDKKSEF